jgi:hypothetical protein
MKPESSQGMVKILFHDRDTTITETLWATPVEPSLYQLDNSPFFAYGLSWQDIVEARPRIDDVLEYVRCVKKSGNRTLRVIFKDDRSTDPAAEEVLKGLCDLGCSYEGMPPRLISINLPPRVGLGNVTDFLKRQTGLQLETPTQPTSK